MAENIAGAGKFATATLFSCFFWMAAVLAQIEPKNDNAALIVGGADPQANGVFRASVELFGCPNKEATLLDDFESEIYLTAGQFIQEDDNVLVCGGYTCLNSVACQPTKKCFRWKPDPTGQWEEITASLNAETFNHIIAMGPNLDVDPDGNGNLYPIILGRTQTTEIFDGFEWQPYNYLPEHGWLANGCLIQKDHFIYHIRTNITRLNLKTWEDENLGAPPDQLEEPVVGRCSYLTLRGNDGKG